MKNIFDIADDPKKLEDFFAAEEIADELLIGAPLHTLADRRVIAAAIRDGASRAEVLTMPETKRWPRTQAWLENRLR